MHLWGFHSQEVRRAEAEGRVGAELSLRSFDVQLGKGEARKEAEKRAREVGRSRGKGDGRRQMVGDEAPRESPGRQGEGAPGPH